MDINTIRNRMSRYNHDVVGKQKEYAIMILLTEKDDGLHFIYEKRADFIKQPGEVCFPGGKIEVEESILQCALRETEEELGICPTDIEVLGRFDSILEVNRVRIHSIVGFVNSKILDTLTLSPLEVAEVFTVPLAFFLEAMPIIFESRISQDTEGFPYDEAGISPDYHWRTGLQKIYIYHWKTYIIWGLTAEISQWFVDKMWQFNQ